ncbi:MAG: hypothetical protein ACTSQZ_01650 [Candidatus Thorarchaeota archaeon]
MMNEEWEQNIRKVITGFPQPYQNTITQYWDEWLTSNPEPPFFESWSNFASLKDDSDELFTEKRVYLKRVTNELRDREIPLSTWQKVAKALAAVASIFLVIFLALSRVARASE